MSSFRSEPIVDSRCWIGGGAHLSGTLPARTGGDPLLPAWLELFIVAAVGVVPVLWMQLRPFYIFAILAIALKQEQLSSQQRKF